MLGCLVIDSEQIMRSRVLHKCRLEYFERETVTPRTSGFAVTLDHRLLGRTWLFILMSLVLVLSDTAHSAEPSPSAPGSVTQDQFALLKERQELLVEAADKSLSRMEITFAIVGGL